MRSSRIALVAGVAAVLAIALIVALAFGARTSQVASAPSPTATTSTPVPATTAPASPSPTPTASPSLAPTARTGAITGRLSYPSDFIPPVTVYAWEPNQRIWSSVDFPGYGNPPRPTAQPGTEPGTYTLTGVAPGRYWVVAYRNDGQTPDPGEHTREAECMRRTPSGPCPDQTPVLVTVIAGQTTREIDIVTWYPGSGLMPPPPPRPGPIAVCGLLVRYASDGNLRLLDIQTRGGPTWRYRLEQPGTAPPTLQTNQLVRLTGRQIDSGTPEAIGVTDYAAAHVASC